MFARKDIEHDMLSAYRYHRRQLKMRQQNSSQAPRTFFPRIVDTQGEDDQERASLKVSGHLLNLTHRPAPEIVLTSLTSSLCSQSPTSEADASYTYKPARKEVMGGPSEQGQMAASTGSPPQQGGGINRSTSASGSPKLVGVHIASASQPPRLESEIAHRKTHSADSRISSISSSSSS